MSCGRWVGRLGRHCFYCPIAGLWEQVRGVQGHTPSGLSLVMEVVWGGQLGSVGALEGNYPDAANQKRLCLEWFHVLNVSNTPFTLQTGFEPAQLMRIN